MVKGTSRRVIVVESPDTELFEQAIFIVRKNAPDGGGVTAERLVEEACRVARNYTRTHTVRRPKDTVLSPALFYTALGGSGIALLWLISSFL